MTDITEVSGGATWRCADLHLHTPGVTSFEVPAGADLHRAGDRLQVAADYVRRLSAAGISIAAITDYQGVRPTWFGMIQDLAAQADIVVLPGAELSIRQGGGRGLHLLIVCSPDTNPERIAEVIRYEHRNSERLYSDDVRSGHQDVDLRSSLPSALRHIRDELGCVVIAAHGTERNGLIKELGAAQAAELVNDGLIDAIDHCESAKEKLRSTGILTTTRLESLACTLSSDPKRMDEIGVKTLGDGRRRLTWIKLSTVTADSLRLALHDPQTRVLTRRPTPAQHPLIIGMTVVGGFLDGLTLRFNDDLTTLIGGRGAGKSAILETLRYGLGGEPYSDQSERLSLVGYALGSGGQVRIVIERPGNPRQRYEVTRVLNQQARARKLPDGEPLDVPPRELFGPGGSPVILLQREIQAVARDDAFRRRLLDEIIGDEARLADSGVRRTVEEIRRSARAIEDLERQLARRDEYSDRLRRLDADISYYEQQGVAEKLERHSKVGADGVRINTALERLADALSGSRDSQGGVEDSLASAAAVLSSGDSEHSELLRRLAADVNSVREHARQANASILENLSALRIRIAEANDQWQGLATGLDEDLRRIQRELGASQLDPERYIRTVNDRTALLPIVQSMSRHEADRERLLDERDKLLKQLQDERRRGFLLRQRAAATVNQTLDGRLRMDVTYLGDGTEFAKRLAAMFRGSGLTADAIDAISAAEGADGVELSRSVRQGERAVEHRFNLSPAMAGRLVRWLTEEPDRLRQVEVLAPDDRVAISLDVDGVPRDLAALSSGQKATALLLLLFAQRGRPLILDQPEDDLDNHFIYEDVVALLRAEKGIVDPERQRQIIVATHNANIPVNGDAELVLSLADVDARCQVRTRASIDDPMVRSEIRTVLEGGAEAFRRRAEKYGGLYDA